MVANRNHMAYECTLIQERTLVISAVFFHVMNDCHSEFKLEYLSSCIILVDGINHDVAFLFCFQIFINV